MIHRIEPIRRRVIFGKLQREKFAQYRDSKKMQPTVEEDPGATAQIGKAMNGLNNDVPKFVSQARASYLLGMSETKLRPKAYDS